MTKYLDAIKNFKHTYFEDKVRLAMETDYLNSLGASFFESKDYNTARSYFKQALAVFPPNDDALKNLAVLTTLELRSPNGAPKIEAWKELEALLSALEAVKGCDLQELKIALVMLDGILRLSSKEPLDEANYPLKELKNDCNTFFKMDDVAVTSNSAYNAVKLVDRSYGEIIQMFFPTSSWGPSTFFCIYEDQYRVNRDHLRNALATLIAQI